MTEKGEILGSGARFLVVLASATIVVAGLRAAAPILIPFSLALFIAVLSLPMVFWLKRRGVPTFVANLLALLADLAIIGGIVLLVMQSIADLQQRGAMYAARLQNIFVSWMDVLQERGVPVGEYVSIELISVSAIMDFAGGTISRVASFLSATFFVLLILVFMLAEASAFPRKLRAALGSERGFGDLGRFAKVLDEVQAYLVIKTFISLITGLTIGLFAWFMGLDFPVMLGLIGFAMNYIPVIGSIIAAVPALLLAVIQFGGIAPIAFVALGYFAINIAFGNFLDPHLLGRRLGLSTLVVVLSLVFWGWIWGPVGALLAVPLTMVVKIMLENTKDLSWIALMLGKDAPTPTDEASPAVDLSTRV